jgi:hypothetical protein
MFGRRRFLLACVSSALTAGSLFAGHSFAKDASQWADDAFALTGVIVVVRLANLPGELIVVAEGKDWTVEVSEPWLRARAGLQDDMLVKGVIATFQGRRAKDKNTLRMTAEQVIIKGKVYDLTPAKT